MPFAQQARQALCEALQAPSFRRSTSTAAVAAAASPGFPAALLPAGARRFPTAALRSRRPGSPAPRSSTAADSFGARCGRRRAAVRSSASIPLSLPSRRGNADRSGTLRRGREACGDQTSAARAPLTAASAAASGLPDGVVRAETEAMKPRRSWSPLALVPESSPLHARQHGIIGPISDAGAERAARLRCARNAGQSEFRFCRVRVPREQGAERACWRAASEDRAPRRCTPARRARGHAHVHARGQLARPWAASEAPDTAATRPKRMRHLRKGRLRRLAAPSRSASDAKRSASASAASANRSGSVSPHQGARSTDSQASRSAGCRSACVSETRSRPPPVRSPSVSSSMAALGYAGCAHRWRDLRRGASARTSPHIVRSARERRTDALDEARRFGLKVGREVERCSGSGKRGVLRGRRREGHHAAPWIIGCARTSGNVALSQSTRPDCDRKFRRNVRHSTGTLPMHRSRCA